MITSISFKDKGELKGLPRPRTTKTGHIYMPDWVKDRKKAIQMLYLSAAKGVKFEEGPVDVRLLINKKMPGNSWSKKHKREMFGTPAPVKPDIDNIIKLYLDALTGVCWHDDAQVTSIGAAMYYDYTDSVIVYVSNVETKSPELGISDEG